MRTIILASVSPRRRELMKLLKLKFLAVESGYREAKYKHVSHTELVQLLALGKARAAAKKYPGAIIVAGDTVVFMQGRVIGKPNSLGEARKMLRHFSGQSHKLISGAVVMDAATGKFLTEVLVTGVRFKKLSEADIERYIRIGKPLDKAGGYNLQGPGINLIKTVTGDFANNLGLPMDFVFNSLSELGVKV